MVKSGRICLISPAIILVTGCAAPATPIPSETPTVTPAETPSPVAPAEKWPTDSWPRSSLDEQGFDAQRIESTERALATGVYRFVDHITLIRHGRLVMNEAYEHDYFDINEGRDQTPGPYNYYDANWHPYYRDTDLHTLQSVTKSVVSVVIGIAIQRGDLPGIDAKVLDYLGAYEPEMLDERMGRVTLEDVLTMRTGIDFDEWALPVSDPQNIVIRMEASDDWIQFVLDLPMAHVPGEVWMYNSGAVQLLSVVVKEATGLQVDEYARSISLDRWASATIIGSERPMGEPTSRVGSI
jgi:CubicO group peptidase (beta-lactamase class C family)